MNIVYLDIETQHLFSEFPGAQKDYRNYGKLKVALAGTLADGKYIAFPEDRVENGLMRYLNSFDRIVGHNLFGFDYKVLGSYFQFPEVVFGARGKGINGKTFDTKTEFAHIVNTNINDNKEVSWVSLDDIAQRNFGIDKTEDSILIPKMWQDGKYEEVKAHLFRDLELTEKFYLAGCAGTKIKYHHKVYGVSHGEKEVYIKW